MGLVPSVVEEVEVFARVLGEWADGGEVVVLEEVATRVTVDVIGRVVLDTKVCGRLFFFRNGAVRVEGCVVLGDGGVGTDDDGDCSSTRRRRIMSWCRR